MAAKKQKLVDLDQKEKGRIAKVGVVSLVMVALVCFIIVGCLACTQDSGKKPAQMTDAQKVAYWKAMITDVYWVPQNGDALDGLFMSREAQTRLDTSGDHYVDFLISPGVVFGSYKIVLTSESGELVNSNDEAAFTVKFSEKNEQLFMTVSDGTVTVYYEEQQT